MNEELRVLIVDDHQADVLLAQHALERDGLAVDCRAVASENALRTELQDFQPDVVLCDYSIPGFSGLHALDTVQTLRPSTPVLVISGSIPEDTAIACLEHGATDYLLKSNLRRLGPAVRRAVTDTRQRRALEERIEQLSHYDTLTGLPNLRRVSELVTRSIERSRATHTLAALVCLNLDRFRFIDESFGRTLADDVLREVSCALKAAARERDAVARVSGDEFLVVLSEIGDALQVGVLAQGLLAAVAAPRVIAGTEIHLTASAGIALYPDDGADFETLLGKAAAAMHEAKAATLQGGMQFHSSDVVRHAQERRTLETGLRDALRRNELTLHFQPQY